MCSGIGPREVLERAGVERVLRGGDGEEVGRRMKDVSFCLPYSVIVANVLRLHLLVSSPFSFPPSFPLSPFGKENADFSPSQKHLAAFMIFRSKQSYDWAAHPLLGLYALAQYMVLGKGPLGTNVSPLLELRESWGEERINLVGCEGRRGCCFYEARQNPVSGF